MSAQGGGRSGTGQEGGANRPKFFGAPVKRTEDPALITGRGRYVDDIRLPGTLHAAFVRSPHAHAKIHGLNADAARALPGVHAVIAGEGPERAALEDYARREGVADRVHLPGWRQDVGALLAACDVFVSSSRTEPLGNMVLEAWSARRPVVAAALIMPRMKAPNCSRRVVPHSAATSGGSWSGETTPDATASSKSWHT